MHINYYEFNKNDREHKLFLDSLNNICRKYNVNPVPEVESFRVEDSTFAEYIMDNGIRLSWGFPWCEEYNEGEIKLYATLDKEAWLDHVNPFRYEEEKHRKEIETLKALPKDELLKKIQNQKEKIKNIQQEYNSIKTTISTVNTDYPIIDEFINFMPTSCPSNKEIGLSLKLLHEQIELNKLVNISQNK